MPQSVGYLGSTGVLTALNKISESEQTKRVLDGLKRKIRPINNGTKTTTSIPLKTSSGKALIACLQPTQLGMGAPGVPADFSCSTVVSLLYFKNTKDNFTLKTH